jgi:hypothetical protein
VEISKLEELYMVDPFKESGMVMAQKAIRETDVNV